MKTLQDFNVVNKRALIRCDFNVPLDSNENILDDFKIKQTIPTIKYLIKQGAKVILMSHLGRPSPVGKILNPKSEILKFSLKSVALRLEELLKKKIHPVKSRALNRIERSGKSKILFNGVRFLNDCTGIEVKKEVEKLKSGEIILLENLRFHKEEEKNDENFAKELSTLGDIYINDAFGASHRAHSSIVGIPKYLPSCAGFLLEKEIKTLIDLIKNAERPLVAIIGGKKIETKTRLINKIAEIGDFVLIGDLIKKEIKEKNIQFKYPQKIVEPSGDTDRKDINPQTIDLFKEKIALAKTIFWNGPLGMIEEDKFSKGSEEIAKAIIKNNAFSIIGGGEIVEFINKLGLAEKFNYLSTGGGAMLEFIVEETLPGIEALK